MTVPTFELAITRQGWLEPAPGCDYDPVHEDLCSHGDIRLTIGGQVISEGDGRGEYGISEGALGLLRTLESNHAAEASWDSSERVAQRLIPHGCGAMLMFTCPIGIEWSVVHTAAGGVRITDVLRFDTVLEGKVVRFPDLAVELAEEEYQRQVVAFAQKAKEPFQGIEKSLPDDFARQEYREFWDEYDRRLGLAGY
jgi:hypothetical protein